MIKQLFAIAAALLLSGQAPHTPSDPAWLAGSWREAEGERWTEEFWTPMRGGVMLGAGRTGKGEALASWEQTRITRDTDGGLTFWGSAEGKPPVPFKAIESSGRSIVFANPAHDYPQRIKYWIEGTLLMAETSLADGSNAQRWAYSAMGG